MTAKNRRGRPRKYRTATIRIKPANTAKYALFREGLEKGETAISLCKRLHIAKNTGVAWAGCFQAEIRDALHARKIGAERIAAKLEAMLDARQPKWNAAKKCWDYFDHAELQQFAVDRCIQLLDIDPAPKGRRPVEEEAPILIVDFDELRARQQSKELDSATHTISISPSAPPERQGDAANKDTAT